jgi:hypothetical protein
MSTIQLVKYFRKTIKEFSKMEKKDLRALWAISGSFIAYWIFCLVIIAQNFAMG